MSTRSRAAIGIWRSRNTSTTGDRAFLGYMIFMVGLIAIAPLARAVWLSATSPAGVAAFASPAAPGLTALISAALWAGALLLGRDRGPALRPPFLTHALAVSDLARSDTFRGPVLRAGALVTAVTTIAAGLIGSSLASHGLADPLGVAIFTLVGALVGVISTVAWLAGQTFPRAAVSVALSILVLGVVTAAAPGMLVSTPWGWVGLSYPSSANLLHPVALAALAAVLIATVPALMNRLSFAELVAQSARWDAATTHTTSMDYGAATTIYQRKPHFGRHIRAVRPRGPLAFTFLIRDALGAIRTPGRLMVGVVAFVLAGVLLGLALVPATPGWLLGAAAGVIAYAGLGPLTDGIRHAASAASDFPLYGISDAHLLANHALFPLTVIIVVLLVVGIVCSVITGTATGPAIVSSLALGLLALLTRISTALKGPLPLALLTPISTPAGDPMAAVRMAWALDGPLLAAASGASAALAFEPPILLLGVGAILIGTGINRWRHRR
jgi:hypothetical protein